MKICGAGRFIMTESFFLPVLDKQPHRCLFSKHALAKKKPHELQNHMLNWLSSAMYMSGTKSSLFYVLFTDSDTELRDSNLSTFLVALGDLKSVGSFLRDWFFVCLPAQTLFKVSCCLHFAVCPSPACWTCKGCSAHTHTQGCRLGLLPIPARLPISP